MKPKVLIFAGYGLNSEEETAFGFDLAGASSHVAHINDVIDGQYELDDYQILAFPGGFAYADDTGSGNAYANKLRNHLWEKIKKFLEKDKLIIGICNGCQIVTNLGLVPAFEKQYGLRQVAFLHNQSARLVCRWLDMKVTAKTPWLDGIDTLSLPIAHGEGKLFAPEKNLKKLHDNNQIALQYIKGEISTYLDIPANPNGSIDDIAGIIDPTGKVLALMPHPERGMFFNQLPNWPLLKQSYLKEKKSLPKEGPGLKIFQNAVRYFK
jgi:phosphoribosylformylglycinamidine synthase